MVTPTLPENKSPHRIGFAKEVKLSLMMSPRLLISVLTLTILSTSAIAQAHAPQVSESAPGSTATNPKTIASYQQVFSSWKSDLKRLPKIPPHDPNFRTQCTFCSGECPCRIIPPSSDIKTATWPGKPEIRLPSTPLLPSVTDVATATSGPRRTIIVRVYSTKDALSAPESTASVKTIDTGIDQDLDQDQGQDILFHPEAQFDSEDVPASAAVVTKPGDEVTSTFYTLPLSGFHPAAIPLIIAPNSSNTPLTVLSFANTTIFSSFISSSLLSDLNLTDTTIDTTSIKSPYTPEHDLSALLGFPTKNLGVVELDLIVGRTDRLVDAWPFTVFEAPRGANTGDSYKIDLLVGWSFLNHIQAVRLTEEYSGSRDAGPKDGMGVFVQRVFERAAGNRGGEESMSGREEEL